MPEEDEQNPADYVPNYLYDVTLQIKHPTETLDIISEKIGLEPDYKLQVGEPRTAANGASFPGGGVNKYTYWACYEEVEGRRLFSETVAEFLNDLEAAQDFAANLIATGGRITIAINLPGFENIGSVISAADIARMARLGVELSIEVFPKMNRQRTG